MNATTAQRPDPDQPTTQDSPAPTETADWLPVLLTLLQTRSFVFLARDDARAERVAAALAAGCPDAAVVLVPASDALPGEEGAATPANVGARAKALRLLGEALGSSRRKRVAVVSTGEAAARLYPPPAAYAGPLPTIAPGDPWEAEATIGRLEAIGYLPDERVDEPGEYALRGQVLDIFPAEASQPLRIEIDEGQVASIRSYDPASQLSAESCDRLEIGPAREPEHGGEIDGSVTLLDHAPGLALIVESGADRLRRATLAASRTGRQRRGMGADGSGGEHGLCPDARWRTEAARRERPPAGEGLGEPPSRFVERRNPLLAFRQTAGETLESGGKVLLLGTARDLRFIGRRAAAALKREVAEAGSWGEVLEAPPGTLLSLPLNLQRGFRFRDILAIAATDLLGSRADRDDRATTADSAAALEGGGIRTGDVVVDEDHGLAVVTGLEAMDGGGEAIVLRFANDGRRLVPAAEAGRLWRYGDEEAAVRLDSLDGSSWARRRQDLDAALAETARGLVALAAERMRQGAPVLEPDPADYERFVAGFPFAETADQARAIAAVRDDLASGRPMDRLVIGDVGYGKTEVALRAAALAALAGRQVAIAAPTTVLVRQHLETFARRFAGTGIAVAGLSRLSSATEKKAAKAGLADGSVGIVIGTGAVAAKGIGYADLALVIIDEEQRFGAAAKAKLRGLAAAHVLSLSATPIPRTLQSALVGLQDLSVIATPPSRRQPIRTMVAQFDEVAARTALLREKGRGGQSFVVVPRIEDMAAMADRLARLVPDLSVLAAHGKLPAPEIDEVMVRFADGDGDVLLATNIIEAGLDVPRANTMLVWRADRFGLAQLHQLRGRVGRGARRGQVLLLTEPGATVAPRTLARLNTLSAFDRLGAGFAISARDLDLRGAGDLLGEEQAGHLKLIGVELYQHLLGRALRHARGEAVDDWLPTVNLGDEGSLKADWIPDADLRLGLYARLARIADLATLDSFEAELDDRFGDPPPEAATLLRLARIRVAARLAGVERIDGGPAAIALTPRREAAPENGRGKALAELNLEEKNGRWLLRAALKDVEARIARSEELLARLVDRVGAG